MGAPPHPCDSGVLIRVEGGHAESPCGLPAVRAFAWSGDPAFRSSSGVFFRCAGCPAPLHPWWREVPLDEASVLSVMQS